jgi:hypothetical protein
MIYHKKQQQQQQKTRSPNPSPNSTSLIPFPNCKILELQMQERLFLDTFSSNPNSCASWISLNCSCKFRQMGDYQPKPPKKSAPKLFFYRFGTVIVAGSDEQVHDSRFPRIHEATRPRKEGRKEGEEDEDGGSWTSVRSFDPTVRNEPGDAFWTARYYL